VREIIYFAHGNGFPGPCYRQLFNALETRFECLYVDKVGHSERFPVTDNWHTLVDEIIESVQDLSKRPVIAVGHSLGGVLSLLAAIQDPSLFKAVILLDSPLIGRFKSSIVCFSKAFGMIDRLTPAHRTRGRQVHWQTRSQVLSYLKTRKLFQTFSQECLDDYVEYGLTKSSEGYHLRFDSKIEYQIYRTIPHILYAYEGKLSVPTGLIYGSESKVVDRLDLRYMKKHYGIVNAKIKGSHMFPMENPEKAAHSIMHMIDKLVCT
jgi:pimeloyl-ACP methyl ester carboxylesterase